MSKHLPTFAILLSLLFLIIFTSCENEAQNRKILREKLDGEFEAQTDEIKKAAQDLTNRISKLAKGHESLDLKRDQQEFDLKGIEFSPEDKLKQEQHMKWDKLHRMHITNAKRLIERFDKANELHEELEKGHDHASLEEIQKEHERFESELKIFKKKFKLLADKLEESKKQMEVVFKEHDEMMKKYGKK